MRSLEIDTRFYEDQDEPKEKIQKNFYKLNQVYLNKHSAAISLENTFKTILLKRMFTFWTTLQQVDKFDKKSQYDSVKEEYHLRQADSRLRQNINSIRQLNKNLMSRSSSSRKKVTRSLSPTSSHSRMNESRAIVLNEIVEKLKFKNQNIDIPEPQDYNLDKRLGKLEKMLMSIKKEHIITKNGNKKQISKGKSDRNYELKTDRNYQLKTDRIHDISIHLEIQKLKLELGEIKKIQGSLKTEKVQTQISERAYLHQNTPLSEEVIYPTYVKSSYPIYIHPQQPNIHSQYIQSNVQYLLPLRNVQASNLSIPSRPYHSKKPSNISFGVIHPSQVLIKDPQTIRRDPQFIQNSNASLNRIRSYQQVNNSRIVVNVLPEQYVPVNPNSRIIYRPRQLVKFLAPYPTYVTENQNINHSQNYNVNKKGKSKYFI